MMRDPPASTEQGVVIIITIAICGMMLGYLVRMVNEPRHAVQIAHAAYLQQVNRDRIE